MDASTNLNGRQHRPGDFVGRQAELRRLRLAARNAQAGVPSLVLLEGAPGIGKTALLHRFLGELSSFTVITARAADPQVQAPYNCLAQLGQVLSAGGDGMPLVDEGHTCPPDTATVGTRLTQLMRTARLSSPLALVVDDAQWADAESLQVLAYALRGLPHHRMLTLLVSRRLPSWDDVTRRAVESAQPVMRIPLHEMSPPEVAVLVSQAMPQPLGTQELRQLHSRTGGHPLYVTSLLAAERAGAPKEAGKSLEHLPTAVVLRQLSGLPAEAVKTLEALALLGGTASLPTLGALLGQTDCGPALALLEQQGFIYYISAGEVPGAGYRHAVLRDAVYAAIPLACRRELHAAASTVVEWRDVLPHKLAATPVLDVGLAAEALEVVHHDVQEGRLVSAARLLVSLAGHVVPDDDFGDHLLYGAVRLFFWAGANQDVLRHRDGVATRRPSAWRDEALGLAEFAAGRLTAARQLLVRAHQTVPTGQHQRLHTAILTELAAVEAILGLGAETVSSAEAAMALHAAPDDIKANATTATDGRWTCDRGKVTVSAFEPPGVLGTARALAAYGTALQDGAGSGLSAFGHLPDLPDRVAQEDVAGLTLRGVLRLATGKLAAAEADLTSARSRTRTGGVRILGACASIHLALCHFLGGNWEQASRGIEQALGAEHGHIFDEAVLWSLSAAVRAARGQHSAGDHAKALEVAQQLDYTGPYYHTSVARAMGARARGDHRGVVAALQGVAEHLDHSERVRIFVACWLPFFVDSLIACGFTDHARLALTLLAANRDPQNILLAVADGWLRGRVAEADGDRQSARVAYTEAIEKLQPGDDIPLIRGLLEQGLGRCAAALDLWHDANEHFASALAVFDRLGARPFVEECRSELAFAGTPKALSKLEGVLTDRERQVTHLIGRGHTNREIAEELLLSVKTIEYHLHSIFSKLGVRNRQELRRHVQAFADG